MSKVGDVLSEQLKRITDGVWGFGGEAPSRWASFCIFFFFGKKSYFNAIGSHFPRI